MEQRTIEFHGVSKFYGEVLGVNEVSLSIPPGITSLVGPNGAGKTTLLNLVTGLLRPTRGEISVLGISPSCPEALFRFVGYCAEYDAFPRGMNGYEFLYSYLRVHGYDHSQADERAWAALELVGLTGAAERRIAGYSKGMRQRVKLAQALAHGPQVLVLDEPLNGLDPMARSEVIELLRERARRGCHVIVSSHILHEVDLISDRVVMLHQGYVVAEGPIRAVRGEMQRHPLQILVRCEGAPRVASRLIEQDHVVEVRIHEDRKGLLVRTRDPDRFYELFQEIVLDEGIHVEMVTPADEDADAVYRYLTGPEEERL